MVTIQMEYQGDLHCKAVHGPSGTELNTDAPKDNQGRGESFSPTDLVATALGTCMLTVMGILRAHRWTSASPGPRPPSKRRLTAYAAEKGLRASASKSTSLTPSPLRTSKNSSELPIPAPYTRACTLTSRPRSNSPGHKPGRRLLARGAEEPSRLQKPSSGGPSLYVAFASAFLVVIPEGDLLCRCPCLFPHLFLMRTSRLPPYAIDRPV